MSKKTKPKRLRFLMIDLQHLEAFASLSGTELKVIMRIELENARHRYRHNGSLIVTRKDFVAYGVGHTAATAAVQSLEAKGWENRSA